MKYETRTTNPKIRILDEAFHSFKEMLDEYASTCNLSEQDHKALLNIAEKAYLEKRMTYFLEGKLQNLSLYLNFALSWALDQESNKHNRFCDQIMYVKHLKHTFTNER